MEKMIDDQIKFNEDEAKDYIDFCIGYLKQLKERDYHCSEITTSGRKGEYEISIKLSNPNDI